MKLFKNIELHIALQAWSLGVAWPAWPGLPGLARLARQGQALSHTIFGGKAWAQTGPPYGLVGAGAGVTGILGHGVPALCFLTGPSGAWRDPRGPPALRGKTFPLASSVCEAFAQLFHLGLAQMPQHGAQKSKV